jgi:hypothetical protein
MSGIECQRRGVEMGADNRAEKVVAIMDATETFVRDILLRMNGRLPDDKTLQNMCMKIRAILKAANAVI